VSLKTLVKNSLKSLNFSANNHGDFTPEQFDAAVMTTYGRFPIALTRGQGFRYGTTRGVAT
jgi:acetylornithine/N-succinyldiaminopimelate aminotransferase